MGRTYESQKSPEAIFILPEPALPSSLIYIRQLTTGVEISWPNNENKGIASFNIYRRLPEENKYIKLGSVKPEDGKFMDKKFIKGKLNIYAVTVTNNLGESDKSIENTLFIE